MMVIIGLAVLFVAVIVGIVGVLGNAGATQAETSSPLGRWTRRRQTIDAGTSTPPRKPPRAA
jgi:hypothetical protein